MLVEYTEDRFVGGDNATRRVGHARDELSQGAASCKDFVREATAEDGRALAVCLFARDHGIDSLLSDFLKLLRK